MEGARNRRLNPMARDAKLVPGHLKNYYKVKENNYHGRVETSSS